MISESMRMKNLYLIVVSIAMLLILMGTAVAETYNVQNVQFEQNKFGSYNFIELNGYRQMVGYGTNLDKSVIDAAKIGNAIFDINLLKNGYASEVLIDARDEYFVATGDGLELYGGYVLNIAQVDLSQNSVLIELVKNSVVMDTKLLRLGYSGEVYAYNVQDFGGYNNVPIIIVHVVNTFAGTDTPVVTIDGIFQISDSLTTVKIDVPTPIVVDEPIVNEPIEKIVDEPNASTPSSKNNPGFDIKEFINSIDYIKFIGIGIGIILLLIVLVAKTQSTNKQNKTITPNSTSGKSSILPIITTAFGYKGATIQYKVKVENPTSEPIADIKVNLYVPDVFLASESSRTIPMLKPGEGKTATFEIRPTGECGDCEVSGKVIYYDYSTKKTSEIDIPAKSLSIVCPMLKGKEVSESEWHNIAGTLIETEESTREIDMSAETLFMMISRIVKDMHMHRLEPEITNSQQLFNGVARFYGEGVKGLKYAAQVEVVGGAKKSRLILKTWAEKEEALTGFYHGLLDEIEKRVHVKEYINDNIVQNVYHHHGDKIGTQVKDSIVQRSNIGAGGNVAEKKCPTCGTVAEGNGKFCNGCGGKL